MKATLRFVLAAALAMVVAATTAHADEESLYDRLGGVYPIATVVDEFIDRLLVNDTLNSNPAIDKARKRVPPAGLKYQVTAFVAQAAGGPQVYTGRSMAEAHDHLNIDEREWRAMVAELRAVLYMYNVPEAEQDELLKRLGGLKESVVTAAE